MTCMNCGYDVVEQYCARCGQPRRPERLHLRPMLREAADAAFNLDSGLLHTVLTLSRRPGHMVREYLAGRTRPYTGPAKYLIVCAAAAMFVSIISGFTAMQTAQVADVSPEAAAEVAFILETMQRYYNLLMILGLPILPLLSRVLFRASGLNLTEHLVFNTYVYAQQNLIWVLVLPAFFLVNPVFGGLIYLLAMADYYVWAARQAFGYGLFSTVIRGTVVMVVFTAVYSTATGVGLTLLAGGQSS